MASRTRRSRRSAGSPKKVLFGMRPVSHMTDRSHRQGRDAEAAAAWFARHAYLVPLLDGGAVGERVLIVSDHVDAIRDVHHGYGKATRPEDYLDGFAAYLRENL